MLSFNTPDGQFNYRVAAVILRGDEVLLQVIGVQDYWCLPGGRVDFGESERRRCDGRSSRRSAFEPRIERLLWVVENLYQQQLS